MSGNYRTTETLREDQTSLESHILLRRFFFAHRGESRYEINIAA